MTGWSPSAGVAPEPAATSVTYGAVLTFETLQAVAAEEAPVRIDAQHHTLMRVIAGVVRLTVGDDERLLAAGDEAIVPAAMPHRVATACGEARFVSGLQPARR
jgi:mannose-6-phosphate isomerase-like protein (cupin superfamily)